MSKKKKSCLIILYKLICECVICMYVCVFVAILMKKKFYQLFFQKKIILSPLILNINDIKIITSVPVYEKCTSNNPPTTTTLPPKKCLCRPKIDLFLVCFPNYYFPPKKFRSNSNKGYFRSFCSHFR